MSLIKAVTFDLWNTLLLERNYVSLRINYLADILRGQNILCSHYDVKRAYTLTHDYVHQVWEKENYRYVSTSERVDYMMRPLNVGLPMELRRMVIKEFKETILKAPPPLFEGVTETLRTISDNYQLGIVCDTGITPGYVLRNVLKRRGVLDLFASTVFSNEVGFNKPHKIIFETALKELGAKPREAAHVGDSLKTDIAGAKAVGMIAIWINRGGRRTAGHAPHFGIRSLPKIISIIKES